MPHDSYTGFNMKLYINYIEAVSLNDVGQYGEWVGGIKKFFCPIIFVRYRSNICQILLLM